MRTYQLERITNGIIVDDGDEKTHYKDVHELMKDLACSLHNDFREADEHQWDGKFEISFGSKFSNMRDEADSTEEEEDELCP